MSRLTEKDLAYALQFAGERLLQTIRFGKSTKWTLSKSGQPVDKGVAEKFTRSAHCYAFGDALLGGNSQTFGWKE